MIDWHTSEWTFDVSAGPNFLYDMARTGYPDFWVIEEAEDHAQWYFWSSPHFNDLSDPHDVIDRASALKMLFDGALALLQGKFSPWSLNNFRSREKSCSQLYIEQGNVLVPPFSSAYLSEKFRPTFDLGKDFLGSSLFAARYDEGVRSILSAIGYSGYTWVSLYQLYDTLKFHGWDEDSIAKQGLASKSELNLFRHTANNSSLLGPLARHGQTTFLPPPKPMRLTEATELWRRVAVKYINNAVASAKVQNNWNSLADR